MFEGTTKRKELHGTTCIHALSGTWDEKLDGTIFQAYKFDFSCSMVDEIYSGFVLLIESRLDDDVGNVELDLYLISRMVKSHVSSSGQVHLDSEQVQLKLVNSFVVLLFLFFSLKNVLCMIYVVCFSYQMMKARCFQEFFFNGLFGRLFVGSESAGTKREFLLQHGTNLLWGPSHMYLLLPLETLNTSSNENWRINWTGINSAASVVEFLKRNSFLGTQHCNGNRGNSSPCRINLSQKKCKDANIINFVNCSVNANDLKDMVVLAIHTGRIYSIVEVVSDSSAKSPFVGDTSAETSFEQIPNDVFSDYNTFIDYFHKK
jgi:endoribonuclease Dicer